jgi:cytochrome P450 family 4
MYNIGKYPDVQQKAFEEVMSVLNDTETTTMADLNKLDYLELVIKETLRMFTPVPIIGRIMQEDTIISNFWIIQSNFKFDSLLIRDGKMLPKGSTAIINLIMLGRNEKVWKDPLTFMPERFANDGEKSKLMSFGLGPRNCKIFSSWLFLGTVHKRRLQSWHEYKPHGYRSPISHILYFWVRLTSEFHGISNFFD